jgi:hypothetical protein
VRPRPSIAFNLLSGELQCITSSGAEQHWRTRTADVAVGDPAFVIIASKWRTVVRVRRGIVAVTGRAHPHAEPTRILADMQSTIPANGDPGEPVQASWTSKELSMFSRLPSAPPFLGRPAIGGSDALRSIFDRTSFVVGFDESLVSDEAAAEFAKSFLSFLAKSWGLRLAFEVTTPSAAARALSSGGFDAFVTADPGAVPFVGREQLGANAGATAIPFFADSNGELVSIDFPADAGATTAVRRFVGTTALQTDDYRRLYAAAFGAAPPFGPEGEIAFPTAAHARGTSTRVHRHFTAVVRGKIAAGLKVVERLRGACDAPSAASTRSDAWHCTAGATEFDPCFSGIRAHVVCPTDPAAVKPITVAVLSVAAPLPETANPGGDVTRGRARLVRTTDGLCTPLLSSKIRYGGKAAAYVCRASDGEAARQYLVGEPYRGAKPWAIVAVPAAIAFGKSVLGDAVNVPEIWWW